jgi:hypothetical protein
MLCETVVGGCAGEAIGALFWAVATQETMNPHAASNSNHELPAASLIVEKILTELNQTSEPLYA